MTVFRYGDEIIVIDAGMAFPEEDMLGIDIVIPDFSYLIEHKDEIKAILITHGHEDHIGSLSYLLREVNAPVYATRLTCGLIEGKLKEAHITNYDLHTVKPGDEFKTGLFKFGFFHVCHSIPDSCGIYLRTPVGTIVHTGDFKIDSTPIDGEVIDLARLGELGKEGVLCLCADSTNVERPGYTMSEKAVGATFKRQFTGCDKRIIVTTFASNVHRIQQIMDAAAECGRKVAVTGRSMENVTKVAMDLGYMKPPKNTVVDINKIKSMPLEKQVIVTTGSQGEEMSALYRMAFSTHKQVDIGPGDKVIISASGMCEAGRIRHHLKHNLWRPECTILFVGYQAVGTLGRTLIEGATDVKLFGEPIEVRAEICQLTGLSGHADKNGLLAWINAFAPKPKRVFIVHGDDEVENIFAQTLTDEGFTACAPYNGAQWVIGAEGAVCVQEGTKARIEHRPSEGASRAASVFQRLVSAGKRLLRVIEHNEGGANKDLAKFADQINALCDKWDR